MPRMKSSKTSPVAVTALLMAGLLTGCAGDNELDVTSGVGVTASRSLCPAVGVPVQTGDVTLFNPASSRDARAIDVVATITNVRTQCSDAGERVYAGATFDVIASRRDGAEARDVQLPYFATVVQGQTNVVSKQTAMVTVHFDAGQTRAKGAGQAGAYINREAASLPDDIREKITRKRKVGDADAALDPMADPAVKAAVAKASFELLVGFQLTQDQLQYNVTR